MTAFFWAQNFGFWPKNPIFATILVDDPFLALGMTVNFPPWKRFFDFPFRSYSCFRKKIRLTCQKVFPLPTVGAPSAGNSPSALFAYLLFLEYVLEQQTLPRNICKGVTKNVNQKQCQEEITKAGWMWQRMGSHVKGGMRVNLTSILSPMLEITITAEILSRLQ